jgi:hypothetical protein
MNATNFSFSETLKKAIEDFGIRDSTEEEIDEIISNRKEYQTIFLREILSEVQANKTPIWLGMQIVQNDPGYEIAEIIMRVKSLYLKELEKGGFINRLNILCKFEGMPPENIIYADFEFQSETLIKRLRLELKNIAKAQRKEKEKLALENRIMYQIKYNPRDRRIILNGKYLIKRPDFNTLNSELFEYAYNHVNDEVLKSNFEADSGITFSKTKRISNVVYELGFSGQLRELFFPSIAKRSFLFRNYISEAELNESGIDQKDLGEQIKSLGKIRNSKAK